MINLEKLYEMMNPSKTIEALNLGKMYDVKTQTKMLEKSTDQSEHGESEETERLRKWLETVDPEELGKYEM